MTSDELQALRNNIADAETAYRDLMLGNNVARFVDQNREQVEFSSATRSELYTYIQQLKAQLPCGDAMRPVWPTPLSPYF